MSILQFYAYYTIITVIQGIVFHNMKYERNYIFYFTRNHAGTVAFWNNEKYHIIGIFRPRPEPSYKRLRFLREIESPCSLLPTCFTKHSCDPFVDRG